MVFAARGLVTDLPVLRGVLLLGLITLTLDKPLLIVFWTVTLVVPFNLDEREPKAVLESGMLDGRVEDFFKA